VLYHILQMLFAGRHYAYENPLFRATIALLMAFVTAILIAPPVIRALVKLKIGDIPEFDNKKLNELMQNKANVPTMGGIIIIAAIVLPVMLLADLTNFYIHMALLATVWLAAVGGIDDWLKLSAKKRGGTRDGLKMWEKLIFQLGLGVVLAYFIYKHGMHNAVPNEIAFYHKLYIPFYKGVEGALAIPLGVFMVLAVLVIAGTSNAVNFTDGLDGLASGCTAMVGFTFMLLAMAVGTTTWAEYLLLPHVPHTDELAILCGAMVGACLGFLWYNCYPARIFMGDIGSVTLGGLIGYVAVVTRQEIMLVLVGAIFVIEGMSVVLQIASFKLTGKRIFRCAPIHHHFQMGGWKETQVVIRFWLASAICAAAALASLKLR
jgi:phospho-N-acetylmuramoyl-pentapeptide-transferase